MSILIIILIMYYGKLQKRGWGTVASNSKPFVYFGGSKVEILRHEIHNHESITSHRATIAIQNGLIERVYLANEVLDLVSRILGYDPLNHYILGLRVATVKDETAKVYGLHWSTTKAKGVFS